MRIWCFNDAHNWGAQLAVVAKARGHDARIFDDPREPDEGFAFVHMHHHPQVRLMFKRVMSIMAMNPALTLLPDIRGADLYDDKIRQAQTLSRWMPRTHVFYTPGAARRYLDREMKFPFVSKSSEGSSQQNVRTVVDVEQARLEIKHAFSDIGIKGRNQQTQRGYLLWQRHVTDEGDVRVIAVGEQRLVLRRSSSAHITPVTELDAEVAGALARAEEFIAAENFKWCGVDLVQDKDDGRWHVTEVTVSWTLHQYSECAFFVSGKPTTLRGDRIWDVLVTEIENGAFDG